ncbi:hypothetical protein [Mycobacterium sp. 1423905.2]|uniref:hypothetical protein n=1 Tax=Mycobacterium sp. 1423905.2 TaxID=1856859 RepID=UPI0007FBE469|nr:hypothetical protein [Mycobacterium sp. 1423905.2]OBJ54492.1 hypothetical protein A9W95_16770 [Mycobacterium sp. 1423905.2]
MHGGGQVVGFVLLLVLGLTALQALIWIPIVLRFRRRYRAALVRLAADIESEVVLRPTEKATYRGATAPGYPTVNNNGVIALTQRRVAFLTVTGKPIDIPLTAITGVREAKAFRRSAVGGRSHLLVQLSAGEVGFFVVDNAAWIGAITNACRPQR